MERTPVPRGLSTLGDPTRARIVQLIRDAPGGRALVGSLAEELQLRQPTVSHHMSVLREEGVVVREPDGRRVWYSLSPEFADKVDALLAPAAALVPPDLDRIVRDLSSRYRGVFGQETVRAIVEESSAMLAHSGSAATLASRTSVFTASRLDAMARASAPESDVPTVLFVCVENAGRSQIAGAILRHLAGDRVIVRTAGSHPTGDVRHSISASLEEIGVPLAGEFPKPLTDDAVRAADVVVTMGCGDACPVYPGRRYLDWDLADPQGGTPEHVRDIRDDIEGRVRGLLEELLPQR